VRKEKAPAVTGAEDASGWSHSCTFNNLASIKRSKRRAMTTAVSEMSDSAWKTLRCGLKDLKETTVCYLNLIDEVCALVRSFISAIRTFKLRTAHRKVWFFGQKVVWRARIINRRVSERKTAVLALQGPSRHQTKCALFAPRENTGNHLAWLSTPTHRGQDEG